ncbi:MAG: carbonic anhydrase [Cellvibrionaceae bacterium]
MPISKLLENNINWSESKVAVDPDFFERLKGQQTPEYLWIGCADSRVPANEIVGLDPGELFVHRNVANIVSASDLNCLSVMQYAIDVLKVKHVIVCGHYGCGGVRAALEGARVGLVDHWLGNVRWIKEVNQAEINAISDIDEQADRLCELNVLTQARNTSKNPIVRDAWARGQELSIHSWIYRLDNGKVQTLTDPITEPLTEPS